MQNKFEAKIDLPIGSTSPDIYDSRPGQSPPDSFTISLRRDNSISSKYGDLLWDISIWHPEGRHTILCFDFWKGLALTPARDLLSRDARWILFSLIWLRDGPPFSVATMQNYMRIVRALALYASDVKCRIPELISDEKRLRVFADNSCSGANIKLLCSLLSNLARIGDRLLGFCIVGNKLRKVLQKRSLEYKLGIKQHPPIPTRVYSTILSSLAQELAEWELVSLECLKILQDCGIDPYLGRKRETQQKIAIRLARPWQQRPEWADIASLGLREYLKRKGMMDSLSGLGSLITEIQMVAKLTILAFSGMRDDEVFSLPYKCIETTISGGSLHRLIRGRTTKLSKGPKSVCWVTNREGHRAIELAQQIAAAIYFVCGITDVSKREVEIKGNGYPLFVSISYLAFGVWSRTPPADGHFFTGRLPLERHDRLRARLQPSIKDADIVELEKIDEHRAWRSEDRFKIDNAWILTAHQLRRSLALYAQRSGLVSLPSLRQQLQHITDEMSRYYARGSLFAKDIFGEDTPGLDHFSWEWQSTQIESETISYAINVLLTDVPLFGGHAAFVAQRLQGADGIVAAKTRAETVHMFKKGQLRYRETLIGGCTRIDECEFPALDWLNMECVSNNCSNMVGNLGKLEEVITEQERLVKSLPPASLLYRTENTSLITMMSARDKVRQKNDGVEK